MARVGGIGMGAGYTMRKRRNKRDGRRLFYRKVAMAGDRADGREKYKISHSFLKGEHWI